MRARWLPPRPARAPERERDVSPAIRAAVAAALAAGAAGAASVALAPLMALATPAGPGTSAPGTTGPGTTAPGTIAPAGGPRHGMRGSLLASQCLASSSTVSRSVPWAQRQLQPAAVWGMTEGAGQTVAVLDSGVSAAAPALSGAVLPGLDVGTGRHADTDCTGHGTFVAGLVAARPWPGSGFAGLAPQAQILPVNVVNASGSVTSAAVAAGINFAVTRGATVIDVAAATTPGPSPELRAAVANAAARNVVVIAPLDASGLNGANQVSYPAAYPGVIAVAAVDSAGAPLAAAGPGAAVDLAAPGSQITSIGPLGPGEIAGDGAALATGYVAGAAALVRGYYPRLSAAQVVHRLEVTADSPGTALPDPRLGYGIVAPYTAVTTILPEESGGRAPAAQTSSPMRLPPLRRPDTWPVTAALLTCAVIAVGMVAAIAGAHIVRSGRSRRWRPPPASSVRHQPSRSPLTTGPPDSRP